MERNRRNIRFPWSARTLRCAARYALPVETAATARRIPEGRLPALPALQKNLIDVALPLDAIEAASVCGEV